MYFKNQNIKQKAEAPLYRMGEKKHLSAAVKRRGKRKNARAPKPCAFYG